MGDWGIIGRVVENIGSSGLVLFLLYKLLDKWAARFLDAQEAQAKSMGELATAVKETSGDQRDLLMAVRVLATKQDETREWVKELLARSGGPKQ